MIAALVYAAAVSAAPPLYPMYGVGSNPCSDWLSSSPAHEQEDQWILGYWSARNPFNFGYRFKDSPPDEKGVLDEVRKVCTQAPGLRLLDAVATVQFRMTGAAK